VRGRVAAVLLWALAGTGWCGERPQSSRRFEIAGAVLFGGAYTVSLGLSIRYEQGELAVPLLGPLIDLHRCHDCTGSRIESGIIGGLVLDFALQATGIAFFSIGMIKHGRVVKL